MATVLVWIIRLDAIEVARNQWNCALKYQLGQGFVKNKVNIVPLACEGVAQNTYVEIQDVRFMTGLNLQINKRFLNYRSVICLCICHAVYFDFFCRRHYKMKFDIDPGYIF